MSYNMLIAEDEKNEYDLVIFLLQKLGLTETFNVLHASNGKQALDILGGTPIDVLLTDIEMPFVSGIDLAKKAREGNDELPILFFSCYDNFSYAKAALSVHACNYMLKPLDPKEFEATMDSTLKLLDNASQKKELPETKISGTDGGKHSVELVKKYIKANYYKNISLNSLAEMVYLNTSYLSTIFKAETGCGINKYIKNVRMEKAREMLLTTNMKIADIGISVGFKNDSYFVKSFRDHFGKTPEKVRSGEN
ncbi:response regulator transcription factor [Butyrivibrio sp. LC3010]|uniref:response regulator transcription factor n=1 Tax=Butyrivibrio sp. LC3010 TaxID=1280680 RepID=UPI000428AF72|nr:helix-turn-helix domain-containing protein [Butyrivibrio sp. LC3010]